MKTFLLGMGAQKTGTGWLYNYLKDNKKTDFGVMKEYHIFDAMELNEFKVFKNSHVKSGVKTLKTKDLLLNSSSDKNNLLRIAMMADYQFYFSCFTGLLSQKDCFLTGDITP